jgi:predicted nuclease of predicted toxin-antitoxin system
MKLLIDMNLSPRWAEFLSSDGFEATHWSVLGPCAATDVEIMAYARSHGHTVLTQDLDFGAILAATGGEKPSVVQIRAESPDVETIGAAVVAALRQTEDQLEVGALLTVDPKRFRLRILPLRTGR